MRELISIMILATSIWVFFDARKIGVKEDMMTGLFSLGPGGWAICCLLLWIIAFPAYLIKRPKYIAIAGFRSRSTDSSPLRQGGAGGKPVNRMSTEEIVARLKETKRTKGF